MLRADVFVVRILGRAGLTGRVEHVQTGEKHVFNGLEELGHAIEHMQRRDGAMQRGETHD